MEKTPTHEKENLFWSTLCECGASRFVHACTGTRPSLVNPLPGKEPCLGFTEIGRTNSAAGKALEVVK
jgi:hypothetical protein